MFSNKIRDNSKKILHEELNKFPEFSNLPIIQQTEVVEICEEDCFDAAIRVENYSDYLYKIITHLNDELVSKIINGDEVWNLSSKDMNPNANKAIYDKLTLQSQQKVKEHLLYDRKCPVCKHTESKLLQFQSRSADEMETIKRECTRCYSKYN